MKMGLAKLCELLAASFLFLTLWTDHTEACYCTPDTVLNQYCRAEIAVKLQVLGIIEEFRFEKLYRIKITKVFKGPKSLKRIHHLSLFRSYLACDYDHHGPYNEDEWVFTGSGYETYLTTGLCDFHKKWDSVSYEVKRGFEKDFKKMCD